MGAAPSLSSSPARKTPFSSSPTAHISLEDLLAKPLIETAAPSSPISTTCSSSRDIPAPLVPPPPPRKVALSSFVLLRHLSSGQFARVYLARSMITNELVVIKAQSKTRATALSELRIHKMIAQSRCHCPFIVPLLCAFHASTKAFLVTPYLSGGELYLHLQRRGRMPESLARFYCSEVVLALGFLHSLSIVYRDLKPENIVLDAHGHCFLVDLGLSVNLAFTSISSPAGTTEYLAPEALLNSPDQGFALDWWAMGMLMYEMLHGSPPWSHTDKVVVTNRILTLDAAADLDFSLFSASARSLVLGLLVKDPRDRLSTAKQVMKHSFFAHVDWIRVAKRGYEPPFIPPRCVGDDDLPGLCNFDPEHLGQRFTPPVNSDDDDDDDANNDDDDYSEYEYGGP